MSLKHKQSNPRSDTGTIKGGNYGIFIEGGSIKNLKNSGIIEGKKDGIAFFNAGGTLHTTITNLEIEQGGIVKGQENGINLSRIECVIWIPNSIPFLM